MQTNSTGGTSASTAVLEIFSLTGACKDGKCVVSIEDNKKCVSNRYGQGQSPAGLHLGDIAE